MSGALPDPLLLAAVIFGLTAVYALYETCRWLAARKAPVPGNATTPQVAAPHTPLRQPPAPGPCTWCGLWPAWDRLREQYVYQWERCPAHTSRERQP